MAVLKNWSLVFNRRDWTTENASEVQFELCRCLSIGLPPEDVECYNGFQISGFVFDRPGFKDGDYVITSIIKKWTTKSGKNVAIRGESWIVTTKSGSTYELPINDASEDQKNLIDKVADIIVNRVFA